MKNGTPVLTFEGGPSETINDGKTEYLVKGYDIDEFAKNAIFLLKHEDIHKNFSKNAREHIIKNFSYNKCVSELLNILEQIVAKKISLMLLLNSYLIIIK